jgi:uncharacterized membrane protein (UPF0182 family)
MRRRTGHIEYNIAATRRAFGLDQVEEREMSGDEPLTKADIDRNAATIRNIRLWDEQPALEVFGQIQEIRTYYDFASVDHDRYSIDGEPRQVMLSARELNPEALPNRLWINEHLTFTHGYGLTLGPVNLSNPESGLPVLFIRDMPPQTTIPGLDVKEPSIYFGELSGDYVFVRTGAMEFHYPKGEDNVYSRYEGRGGVAVGSFWRKLLFAARFGSLRILLSNDIDADSRVLYKRRPVERASTIAPFLRYDRDPYLRLSDGRLVWIQDAYTVSSRYPYSTRAQSGVNYIRNSIKVVTDAYHGDVTFYLIDPADPIAATIQAVFPQLLRPASDMPADLRAHMRYPQDIFTLQAQMYTTYHMTNPAVFYNKEDQWETPAIETGQQPSPMEPYYTIMRLPGEERAEFIQMLPFTPRRKDNLAAWLAARSDGDRYGRLVVFQFPKQKLIFGPRQVIARINQDQVISPQISLWGQQGSQVIQGNLLIIPIEHSLLYIRPLYLRGIGGRIPELRRVIVGHLNQIVMAETLDLALAKLFGDAGKPGAVTQPPAQAIPMPAPEGPSAPTESVEALAARAHALYQRALEAQRQGDWAGYGARIKELGEVLGRLARQPGAEPPGTRPPGGR